MLILFRKLNYELHRVFYIFLLSAKLNQKKIWFFWVVLVNELLLPYWCKGHHFFSETQEVEGKILFVFSYGFDSFL